MVSPCDGADGERDDSAFKFGSRLVRVLPIAVRTKRGTTATRMSPSRPPENQAAWCSQRVIAGMKGRCPATSPSACPPPRHQEVRSATSRGSRGKSCAGVTHDAISAIIASQIATSALMAASHVRATPLSTVCSARGHNRRIAFCSAVRCASSRVSPSAIRNKVTREEVARRSRYAEAVRMHRAA